MKVPIREEEFHFSQLSKGFHVRLVNDLNMGEGRASEVQHFCWLMSNVLIMLTLPLFQTVIEERPFSCIYC